MKKPISILIADDHEIIRTGLESILCFQPDFKVCAQASNGEEAVRAVDEHRPDIVLMDLAMPILDGLSATRQIRKLCPDTRIIILTTYASSIDVIRAIEAGAAGAISKETPNVELVESIRRIHAGEQVLSSDIADIIAADRAQTKLTHRHLEILESLARGLTNKEIATLLSISEDGVKFHLRTIFSFLGAANRTEAIAIAQGKHLLKT